MPPAYVVLRILALTPASLTPPPQFALALSRSFASLKLKPMGLWKLMLRDGLNLFGAVFLVILLIAALIGLSRLKKAMPLKPEQAIRGVKYDLGVLKEGRSFDERTLDARKTPEQEADEQRKQQLKKQEKAANPPATEHELKTRTGQRRAHYKRKLHCTPKNIQITPLVSAYIIAAVRAVPLTCCRVGVRHGICTVGDVPSHVHI